MTESHQPPATRLSASPQQLAAATRRDRGRRVRRLPRHAHRNRVGTLRPVRVAAGVRDARTGGARCRTAVCTGATLVAHHTPDDTPTPESLLSDSRPSCCLPARPPRGRSGQPFGDLWSDDDDTDDAEDLTLTERLEETIDMARSWGVGVGGGLADRVSYEASQSTPWADPPNLSAEATDTRETINGNSTQIVDYLNNQTDAANASVDNTTVHELRLVDEDHALSESIYLVFEYDQTTGQWTTLTAHESYNGSADYEHRFSGFLATNTADETDRFVTEYVADGEPIASDRAYNAGRALTVRRPVRLRRRIDTSR